MSLLHLQRLQLETSGGKLGSNNGSSTSRHMGNKADGVTLMPPLHASGAVTQRGAKPNAWLPQPRRQK